MAERTTRESKSRANTQRRKPWAPPSKLEAPEPPAGYKHRWIRTAIRGEDDKTNVHSKMREGWEPVRADEYPDEMDRYPVLEEGKNAGIIGVGGLMLCRIPEETVEERTEYFREQTRNQIKAVDENLMREQHPSMPIHNDRQSRVSFGGK
jgi:hypothetical protein|tara:strand:- start:353 stop:802 length:450 start_codon:yes stop_codon:yes gene_type:complete